VLVPWGVKGAADASLRLAGARVRRPRSCAYSYQEIGTLAARVSQSEDVGATSVGQGSLEELASIANLAQALLQVIRASLSRMFYGMQQLSRPEL
jgi:hypothetical protein